MLSINPPGYSSLINNRLFVVSVYRIITIKRW
jgi:hypothetical protein